MVEPPLPSLGDLLGPDEPRKPASAPTTLEDELRAERNADVQYNVLQFPSADNVAKANRIAREKGVPAPVVEADLPTFERQAQAKKLTDLMDRYPAIGKWAAKSPRNAAVAVDDHESLGVLGTAWDFLKNAPGRAVVAGGWSLGGMATDTYNAIDELIETASTPLFAGMSALADASGIGLLDPNLALKDAADRRRQSSRFFSDKAQAARERFKGANLVSEALLQGTETSVLSIAAALTRSPKMGAGAIGGLVAGQGYTEARQQGLDIPTSIRYSIQQAAPEYAFEVAPTGKLVDVFTGRLRYGRGVTEYLATELPGEMATTLFQSYSDWAVRNPGQSFDDWLASLPEAEARTALGVIGGGAIHVGSVAAMREGMGVIDRFSRRGEDAQRAGLEQQFIEKAGEAAEQSKLRQRDPEAYAEVVREMAQESGVEYAYVPGEAVVAYMQSDAYQGADDPLSAFEGQAAEAAATGGDVLIPAELAFGQLPGTPAWEAIRQDMRLSPGGESAREAAEFNARVEEVRQEMAAEVERIDLEDRQQRTVLDRLTEEFRQKLQDAGETPFNAEQVATLAAMRVASRAQRLGVDLTGDEFASTEVRQVVPEALGKARKADQTDLVINALRKGGSSAIEATIADRLKAISDAAGFPLEALQENYAAWVSRDGEDAALELLTAKEQEFNLSPVVPDTIRAAAEELDALLAQRGIDPAEMSDAEVREAIEALDEETQAEEAFDQLPETIEIDGVDGTYNYVVFDDSRVNIRAYEQEARGRILFSEGRTIIELFKSRNPSTLIHELGHQWLEELRADAMLEDAPEQLKSDWETVKAWFKANGHDVTDAIPTEAHELWARGIERYLMEGKAPSSALQRVFEVVRGWMLSVYKTVEQLRSPITPEVREVMDRLFATDEEIAMQRERQALHPLFTDAAAIGMTGEELVAYNDLVMSSRDEAQGQLLQKTMRAVRARVTKEYNEQRAKVAAAVAEDVDKRPVFRALRNLKDSPISKEWLVENFGVDGADLLPRRVPPIVRDSGFDPAVVAEMSGFASAREMVEALMGAEAQHRQLREEGDERTMRQRVIDVETDLEMNRRHGDPLTDGTIEREAMAVVNSEKQGEVLATEIRYLARKTGKRPTPYRVARDWARQRVRQGRYTDEASPAAIQRHARAISKAGNAAQAAMLKGDMDEALRFKQQQMLSSALMAEAKEAHDEVTKARRYLDTIAKRRTWKAVDQDYLEQAQALLEAVDLKERSQKLLERKGKFEQWAKAREAEGYDVVVPDSFEAILGTDNWSRLPVETLLGLNDTVRQIIHLGKLKQGLLDRQEQREWDAIWAEVDAQGDDIGRKPPKGGFTDPTWWDAIKSGIASADASLLKMEQVFDWLDNGNPNGVFNRIAFRPVADAQAREQALLNEYYGKVRDVMGLVPEKTLRRWADKVTIDLIDPETGTPAVMTRQRLVAMALNWGNAGNRQRLADGYGWSQDGIAKALNDNLTKEEWAFVQGIWDTIDGLWPEIAALEREVNGVEPEKIEAVEFWAGNGINAVKLRGGYYPAIYDSTKDYRIEELEGGATDKLLSATYRKATTRASSTKERLQKVSRPILLDIGVINRHLGETIHDIAYRKAIIQAHRFLTNPRVQKMVDETLGREVRQQMRPWLQFVANSWAHERAGNEGAGKFFSRLRANTTMVGMGWRITTMFTQLAGYSNSAEYVGMTHLAPEIAKFSAHPIESINFVLEHSDEVRGRLDTLDRDIRQALNQMRGDDSRLNDIRRFAFHGVGYMDRLVVVPTWLAQYNKSLSEGMSEADAAYAADKAVRLSQGAGSPKDLAAIARGTGRYGELSKFLTMFYSYMSAFYQRQRNLGRDVSRASAKDLPGLVARAWWLIVVPPLLAELLSGRGPDDDEEWGWWAFKKMLSQSLGPIPIVRDVWEPTWDKVAGNRGFDYRFTPAQGFGEALVRVGGDAGRIARGEDTKRATRDVLELAGYSTGLVPGQFAAAAQFWIDVAQGDADPQTFGDWLEGTIKGRIAED